MNKGTARKTLKLISSFFQLFNRVTGTACRASSVSAWTRRRGVKRIYLIAVIGLAFTMAGGTPASGEQKAGSDTTQLSSLATGIGEAHAPGLVMLHNRPIVVLRASLWGASPMERAKAVQGRIDHFLSARDPGKVTTKEIPEGTIILMGDKEVLLISSGDLPAFGETREEVINRAVKNLTLAIEEVKEGRSPRVLLRGAAFTLLATILFLFILWVIRKVHGFIWKQVEKLEKRWAGKFQIRGFSLRETVLSISGWIVRLIAWALGLLAAYWWLVFCLTRFPQTRAWGEGLGSFLYATIDTVWSVTVGVIPGLFVALIIAVLTRFVARLLKSFFSAIEQQRLRVRWLDPEIARPTARITVALLWIFALIMAYPYLPGSGTDAFKGVSVLLGIMISLGSTSIVNQAAGGLVLVYSRAFRPGEYVRVGQTEGMVVSLGILSTKIRTAGREEVNIPNAVLVTDRATNYTRLAGGRGVVLNTSVTIGYSTPWRKVHELLMMAAKKTPGIVQQPPPVVRQTALSDFYVEYRLGVVVERPETRAQTLSSLHANIQDVFNEYDEQIMSPHYVADPPEKVYVPKEKWYAAPAQSPEVKEET